jgi:HSP20 family molecular chaperone IbpA
MGVTEAVDGVGGGARGGAPADEEVSEDATSIRICVDMPGVNFKDLKVHLRRNGVLEVRAIRRRLGLDGKTVVRKSKISRRYAIDDRTVNVSKISADLALGVLVITAPKKPARETGTTTPPPQAQSSALAAGYLTPPEREWASMITGADATGAAAVAAAGGNTPSASPSESSSTRDSTMNNPRRVASPCVPRRSSLVGSEPSSPGIMNVRRASKTGVKFDRKVTIAEAANDADASFAAERIAAMASIEAAAASAETASLSSTSWQEGEKALAATPLQDDGTTRAMTAATVETLAALETPTAAVKTMTTAETSPGVALDSSVSFGSDVSRAVGGTGEFYSRGAILPRVSLHGSDQDVGEDGGSGEGERKEVRPGSAASFAEGNVTNGDGERGDVNNGAVPVALAVEESAADGGDNDEGNVADPADPASSSSARRVSVTP